MPNKYIIKETNTQIQMKAVHFQYFLPVHLIPHHFIAASQTNNDMPKWKEKGIERKRDRGTDRKRTTKGILSFIVNHLSMVRKQI